MLIPVEWLRDFVQVPHDPEALAERLTVTGNEIEEIRPSESGPVLYLKLTPNRADMLSIRGAAREIAALYQAPFQESAEKLCAEGAPAPEVRVDIEEPALCPRYIARVIRGVKVGPSPEWLRKRLEAAGERSISNVVDATNYVMLEMGQPLHAFDLDLLEERRIVVRKARPGERLTAIGGAEVPLDPEMLVIADGRRPVALAGIKGGQETEVTDRTVDVLLEAAYFDPTTVRRTAKRSGISSTASYRFERGVDPNGVRAASDRAAQLIAELTGGVVSETVVDVYPAPIRPKAIRFRPERCRALLGVEVSDAEAQRLLERLGLEVRRESPEEWTVTAPTSRPDLAIEEDLIEEVGRLYGYDRLPETLPGGASGAGRLSAIEQLTRASRELLLAQGLYEAVTSTLIARDFLRAARLESSPVWPGEGGAPVPLRNPLSAEFDTLRPSLLPGLLLAAGHNLRHGSRDIYLFEVGYAHGRVGQELPQDRLMVSGLLLGSRWSHVWNPEKALAADFFSAKGTVEALARGLGLPALAAERAEHPAFHPGRSAWLSVAGERLGIVGELHPAVAEPLALERGVYLFELDGEVLLRHRNEEVRYAAPSRFPRALRDIALVVDRSVPSREIERVLRETLGEWGRQVRLFDVYAGKSLPEGKVSLAYALELGAEDRTLTDAEVEERLEEARRRLRAELGAELRG
ncbi:MAG TPA: phenylalanine--tRNA ligase subunit beta [Armatimonadota bacterium]|nr:phenylalanine--tRNA ligase subunit beta [Armatimonadota bacterium]